MNEDKIIDQSLLASDISNKIAYEFIDNFLVKPLDKIKVKKEFTKPVSNKAPKKDKNGIEAVDYDKVETEVKEVDSDFREGIVLKVPYQYQQYMERDGLGTLPIKVGDIIVYREAAARYFDLLKDSQMLKSFDIVAIKR